jgi:hypothetical protein
VQPAETYIIELTRPIDTIQKEPGMSKSTEGRGGGVVAASSVAPATNRRTPIVFISSTSDSLGVRATFTTPESLHGEVVAALYNWRDRHPEFRPTAAELTEPTGDPTAYLEALQAQTSHIDIRGLIVGSGKAT